jgi:long-chain acyl-CoA synthetase
VSLAEALEQTVRCHADRPAVVDPAGNLTWLEFGNRVARAATVLSDIGLRAGDRFGIMAQNSFRQAEVIYAGYWMGAVPVPVNTRLAPREISDIFDDAACKAVVVDETYASRLETEELAPWRGCSLSLQRGYEMQLADATPLSPHDSGEEDDAILLYTGGTTGRSKGVRLTHRNVLAHGRQFAAAMGVRSDDVYLHVAPMFHSADLLGTAFTLAGAAHSFLPRFTPELVLEAVEHCAVTAVVLTPTMMTMILQDGDLAVHDLSSLRKLTYGGAPLAVKWVQRALESFPSVEIRQGYGSTETSCVLATLGKEEHASAFASGDTALLHSAGRPLIDVSVRILDEEGQEAGAGDAGEVVVQGPNITPGYLNRPAENAAAFRDGWFHTGDIGRVDNNGYLYLLDRKKDVIISGDENVFSSEVEAVLHRHPDVHEVAVIGVPDEHFGEALMAVIVPARGATLSEKGMIAFCRGKIGGYKIPRRFAVLDELPKSALGKVLKTELRRRYAKGTEEVA